MTKQLSLAGKPVDPPVVLAPMAGITNLPFRKLCREQGAGIYVCEMITAAALVERNPKTMRLIEFDAEEETRSLQLYGVDPDGMRRAVAMVAEEDLADHIDLNFGCPVPKVTRRGGGSALPWKRELFRQIVTAAVDTAAQAGIPVTVKMRKGIDDEHLTYVDAGRIAEDAGVAWVALHGRTAAERYSGTADWEAVASLKAALEIPVLGNGDIWEADDALRLVEESGCDGVVVGRGCLGRPWLFGDLEAAFRGRSAAGGQGREGGFERRLPTLGEVAQVMSRHAALLVDWIASAETYETRRNIPAEEHGCKEFRKHVAWYLKGFPVGGELRRSLAMVSSLAELDDLLGKLDADAPFPESALGKPRGRTNSPGKVTLPEGWLDDRDDCTVPEGAELDTSGG
ncbi:tRNA dihydrouridine synthase DusB [Glycomyces arizonensis]|uniref:tRNA dihydrouridine synthase DusB n=1 Tax=Glycomyces arizonensis TaxID=256035 RepID=UPI0004047F57|nr:tRNA dihydrouridine synthase DusB [Glycomyces arizonensis]